MSISTSMPLWNCAAGSSKNHQQREVKSAVRTHTITNPRKADQCAFCHQTHLSANCGQFLKQSAEDRFKKCKSLRLCINCLKAGHSVTKCNLRPGCAKYPKSHHTMLHIEPINKIETIDGDTKKVFATSTTGSEGMVFLGTASIHVVNKCGEKIRCRTLLDSGSQISIITSKFGKQLGLTYQKRSCELGGIGGTKINMSKRANIELHSNTSGFNTKLEVMVLPEITSKLPSISINVDNWKIPKNIKLADPQFNKSGEVDLLIGAELYGNLLLTGQIRLSEELPLLQNTLFGWIISGKTKSINSLPEVFSGVVTLPETKLKKKLEQFWLIEQANIDGPAMTKSELDIENHFQQTTERMSSGRFMVRTPFILPRESIGNTMDTAIRRFFALEKRINLIPEVQKEYSKFIAEYLNLGHMEEVSEDEIGNIHCFLPHHCIIRPNKATTKLRVVFDASAKGTNDLSPNEIMAVGPKIQDDLFDILVRFRLPKYVITADIEKMYRQILIHPSDRDMQLIAWRFNSSDALSFYRLKTVTYGTKAASYLSTKCFQQLALEDGRNYPLAKSAVLNDFYMDDILTGCDDLHEAIQMRIQLSQFLAGGFFNLRKWCSNSSKVLHGLEVDFHPDAESKEMTKTVGLCWLQDMDTLQYKATYLEKGAVTKRIIISETAQIFDPLGLVNPVIVHDDAATMAAKSLLGRSVTVRDSGPMERVSRRNVQAKPNLCTQACH